MSGTQKELRALAQAALVADDTALVRLVSVLDELADRGAVDAVLEPVRARLRTLRPPRKLRFARLLFLPLDGAIQSPKDWKRGTSEIPRSALGTLAGIIQTALGAEGEAVATACASVTTADEDAITQLGARLWPAAAGVLPVAPPAAWAASGLAPTDYGPIAALCRPLWQAGPALWEAIAVAAQGPPDELVRRALGAVAPAGSGPLSAALATLLRRASAPAGVAQIAAVLTPQARMVAVHALEQMLAEPPPPFSELEPKLAVEAALRLAERLENLEGCSLLAGERQSQLHAARRAADEACRAGYAMATQEQVLGPTTRMIAAPLVEDAEVMAMEAGARKLRAYEAAGRKLGGAGAYDKSVRELTRQLSTLGCQVQPGSDGLQTIDIARAIEILAGPEVAEQALRALQSGATATP